MRVFRFVIIGFLLVWILGGTRPTFAEMSADQNCGGDGAYVLLCSAASDSKLFSFDYGIPESPALTLAGLSENQLKPATSLKPFVLSLPGIVSSSSGASDVALDISAASLFDTISNSETETPFIYWQPQNYWRRFWVRTRIGAAFSRGDDGAGDLTDAKPSRAAFGLTFNFLDSSDPLTANTAGDLITTTATQHSLSWLSCIQDSANLQALRPFMDPIDDEIAELESPSIAPEELTRIERDADANIAAEEKRTREAKRSSESQTQRQEDDQVWLNQAKNTASRTSSDEQARSIMESCKKQASTVAEHGADLQLGVGVVWSGTPGKFSGFDDTSAAIWLSARFPAPFSDNGDAACGDKVGAFGGRLLSCWMFGGSGRYSAGEMVSTGDKAIPEFKSDTTEGWLGLERVDFKSKLGAYFGYLRQQAVDAADVPFSDSGIRWLVSADYSLDDIIPNAGAWLEGSYGNATGSVTTLNDHVAMLTLKFGPASIGSGFKDSAPPENSSVNATNPHS